MYFALDSEGMPAPPEAQPEMPADLGVNVYRKSTGDPATLESE